MFDDDPFFDIPGDAEIPTDDEAMSHLRRCAEAVAVLQRLLDAGLEVELFPHPARASTYSQVSALSWQVIKERGEETKHRRGMADGLDVVELLLKLGQWTKLT